MARSSSTDVPQQREGDQADIVETVTTPGEEQAKEVFKNARQRLLDVSNWGVISKGISAEFLLTDNLGQPKEGKPEPGDHFRINIPGPGSKAGEGYDWVRVETVEDETGDSGSSESIMIKVRPSGHPEKKEGVAHFLDPAATSSFIVRRHKEMISAEVHGRNEKPNTHTETIPDKIRNAVVGTTASKFAGKIQWKKLVKGLLDKE